MLKNSLIDKEKLCVSIDSDSFNKLITNGNKDVEYILNCSNRISSDIYKHFEFIRSQADIKHKRLNEISFYTFKELDDSYSLGHYGDRNISSLSIVDPLNERPIPNHKFIHLTMNDVNIVSKEIYDKVNLNEEKINATFLVLIQNHIGNFEKIFITTNRLILDNRDKFYRITNFNPTIVDLKEAKEIMGLFLRNKNQFNVNFNLEKYQYYEYSLIFHVPYLPFSKNNNENLQETLLSRFLNLLMSLNEIGTQNYKGPDKNTIFDTVYHFSHFISIITGIFDNLAIITKEKYRFEINHPQNISLNSESGEQFLDKLKIENKKLYDHVNNNSYFIGVLYDLRNEIIHREMPEKGYIAHNEIIIANTLKINKIIHKKLKQCPVDLNKTKRSTFWGILVKDEEHSAYLDPYKFAKSSAKQLFKFTNEYLKLLGYQNYLEHLVNIKSPHLEMLRIFDEGNFDHNFD